MSSKIETFVKSQMKTDLPDIRPGYTVRVHFSSGQTFEGLVIARAHGKEMGATITVRKEMAGTGVEMILPLHSPTIKKIEVLRKGKVRRAKLYYLREATGKRAKIKSAQVA